MAATVSNQSVETTTTPTGSNSPLAAPPLPTDSPTTTTTATTPPQLPLPTTNAHARKSSSPPTANGDDKSVAVSQTADDPPPPDTPEATSSSLPTATTTTSSNASSIASPPTTPMGVLTSAASGTRRMQIPIHPFHQGAQAYDPSMLHHLGQPTSMNSVAAMALPRFPPGHPMGGSAQPQFMQFQPGSMHHPQGQYHSMMGGSQPSHGVPPSSMATSPASIIGLANRNAAPQNFEHILAAARATADDSDDRNKKKSKGRTRVQGSTNRGNNGDDNILDVDDDDDYTNGENDEDTTDDDESTTGGSGNNSGNNANPKFTTSNAKSTKRGKGKKTTAKAKKSSASSSSRPQSASDTGRQQHVFTSSASSSASRRHTFAPTGFTGGMRQHDGRANHVTIPSDIALFSPPVYSTMVMPRNQVPKNHRTSAPPIAVNPNHKGGSSSSGDGGGGGGGGNASSATENADDMVPVTIVYLPFYLNDGLAVMRGLTKAAIPPNDRATFAPQDISTQPVEHKRISQTASSNDYTATSVTPASATRKISKANITKKGPVPRISKTPYGCDKCGKNFISQSKLTRHMLVHTLAKDHGCDICGNRFGQKAALRVHVKRKHGVSRVQCLSRHHFSFQFSMLYRQYFSFRFVSRHYFSFRCCLVTISVQFLFTALFKSMFSLCFRFLVRCRLFHFFWCCCCCYWYSSL